MSCKYCGNNESPSRKEMCEPCFQAGMHHPWWIKPVALLGAILFVVIVGVNS